MSIATFTTSMGTFKAEIPGFMNQFGCPYSKDPNSSRSGTGGPMQRTPFKNCNGESMLRNHDGCIPDEIGDGYPRISNSVGTLSMANTGRPNSGGSQFFINVSDNTFLDWFDSQTPAAHPVFGKVVENMDLAFKISNVPTRNDNPVTPIKMISVRVA